MLANRYWLRPRRLPLQQHLLPFLSPKLTMPSVSAPAKVLVTGASGFLGAHVAKALIDRGYYVRGTVRSSKKGDYLKNLLGSDKFEYVIVEDMEAVSASLGLVRAARR